jgi:hypothetical protein
LGRSPRGRPRWSSSGGARGPTQEIPLRPAFRGLTMAALDRHTSRGYLGPEPVGDSQPLPCYRRGGRA